MKLTARLFAIILAACAGLAIAAADAPDADGLYKLFTNPPAQARPFVRWWWNGNAVTAPEIQRELDIMKAAGIGGIEINPIALPPTNLKPRQLDWLSPEWTDLVRQAAAGAKERGMVADMIIGSGWPFGAEFLKPEEWCTRLSVNPIALTGPKKVRLTREDLIPKTALAAEDRTTRTQTSIVFLRLAPRSISRIDQSTDMTAKLAGDAVELEIPAGEQTLYCGYLERGYRNVVHGAPGASGPVLDHYSKESLLRFLNLITDKLGPALGGSLGPALRAMFVDSIELAGANWTADMAAQFRKRRGYDLMPWLPFVVDFTRPLEGDDPWTDSLRRARYDYCLTLVEVFQERFIETINEWCHANKVLFRYQAYGTPWLMGMEDAYRIPDIPESNNWLFSPDPDSHGFLVWTKYTSSGGHQAGRPIISTEAHTNTQGVFRATLDMIKGADDFNFIMGINHSVLHGFNYSPPEAGFPGWVRYGAYFNEHNTWWPYFKKWADYNARLSAVLQATRPVAEVGILYPSADMWGKVGLTRGPFHTEPPHAHHVWQWIQQNGAAADYVSETILQKATFEGGLIHFGPMAYQALVVYEADTVQPATMMAIKEYVRRGGHVAFVGKVPGRAPGMMDGDRGNAKVVELSRDLTSCEYPIPKEDEDHLAWADRLLDKLEVKRSLKLARPAAGVFTLHQRGEGCDLIFIANTTHEPAGLDAANPFPGRAAACWDPETGQRTPYALTPEGRLVCALGPLESRLLVFGPGAPAPARAAEKPESGRGKAIECAWKAEFKPCEGAPFTMDNFKLQDLARSGDPKLNRFAGTVTYTGIFQWEGPVKGGEKLDLGEAPNAITEAALNGKPLGVRWYGSHEYGAGGALKPGQNTLEIKLTTTLFNYVRTLKDNPGASFAMQGGPKKAKAKAKAAGKVKGKGKGKKNAPPETTAPVDEFRPPDPAGLIGPVAIR